MCYKYVLSKMLFTNLGKYVDYPNSPGIYAYANALLEVLTLLLCIRTIMLYLLNINR